MREVILVVEALINYIKLVSLIVSKFMAPVTRAAVTQTNYVLRSLENVV